MRRLLASLLLVLPLAGCAFPGAGGPEPVEWVSLPAMRFETELGEFTAILYPDEHPESVAFYRDLVGSGYYDGREFGRVIPTFVIQEADRTGGTTDQEGRVPLEAGTRAMFSAGGIGIARDEDPDSGGSQFFVMDHAISTLYGNYTVFAQVVSGMDVVRAIARVEAVANPAPVFTPSGLPVYAGLHDRFPVDPVQMTRVTLTEVALPKAEAERYPLQVGETYRDDKLRATLEWPANLRAGETAAFTWYVAPRGEATLPNFSDARLHLVGPGTQTFVPLVENDKWAGILSGTWTPESPGLHTARLLVGGEEVAATQVLVPE